MATRRDTSRGVDANPGAGDVTLERDAANAGARQARGRDGFRRRRHPLPARRQGRDRRRRRAHAIGAEFPARGPEAHRDEGGLRRGRLRRLHGGGRRDRWRRRGAQDRQRLHPVRPRARRQGVVHGGGSAPAERRSPPRAAGDGRLSRLAMRLLHARLRHVAVGALRRARCGGHAPDRRRAPQRAHRKPLPLHRVPADSRCRRADVRPAARAVRSRGAAPPGSARSRARARSRTSMRGIASSRREPSRSSPISRPAIRRRRSWPAPPTSASG